MNRFLLSRSLLRPVLALLVAGGLFPAAQAASLTEYLSETPERIVQERQEWGQPGLDVCAHQADKTPLPLRMGGRPFARGFGSHASSEIVILLDASCRRFEAEAGIQDGMRSGSATFEVHLDGRPLYQSGIRREGEAPLAIAVDVTGGRLLELRVRDGGDGIAEDLANWGNARLVRDASAMVDSAPAPEEVDVAPFAVVIGSDPRRMDGVHNGRFDSFPRYELHPDWPLAVDDGGCSTPEPLNGEVTVGLRWLERRRLRALELRLEPGSPLPPAEKVRVQRWVFERTGASPGGSRWQGHWKEMAGTMRAEGGRYSFTPDWKGHHQARNEGVQKIRWILPSATPLRAEKLSAWTDTPWTTSSVTVRAQRPAPSGSGGPTAAVVSVYNGAILSGTEVLEKVRWDGITPLPLTVRHSDRRPWKSDATVLRFSGGSSGDGFGVAVDDLLASGTVSVAASGITISLGGPATGEATPPVHGTTVLEEVRRRPDQTFAAALASLERPDAHLGPTMLSLACDNRKFILQRSGSIAFETSAALYNQIDKERKEKYSCLFEPRLGSGTGGEVTRQLEEGWLPVSTITTRRDGLLFRQRVFVAPVGEQATSSSVLFSGARAVAVSEFTVENPTTAPLPVEVLLPCWREVGPGPSWTASVGVTSAPARREGDLWVYEKDGVLMAALLPPMTAGAGSLEAGRRDGVVAVTGTLPPGARGSFTVLLPGWEAGARELRSLPDTARLLEATRAHWQRALGEGATIRLPDTFTENLIRASQVHCMIASRNRDGRLVAPWIGSALYGPLESESQAIIRGMEGFGHFEFARRAHDYFISRYNDEGFVTPTYTVVGTGWHLWALGEYVRLSGDTPWLRSHAGEVLRVCRWISAQLAKTESAEDGRGEPSPLRGLMPPGALADWESFASWYSMNGWFHAGLRSAGQALREAALPEGEGVVARAEKFADAIRSSFRATRALAPVVPLRNGTWAPAYPAHPECPMPVEVLHAHEDGGRSWCYDVELGAHHLIPQGVLDPHSPETDSLVNHMEDVQFLRDGWGCYLAGQSQADWFNRGGFAKVQPFYARMADIHALRDDIKPFLRTWINSAASLVNREDLSLWEHFFNGAWNKTHETGWFLNQAALLFATERGDDLWLAPFVSDQWLRDGMTVEARKIPTTFGRTGFRLTSRVAGDRIEGEVDFPERKKPGAVFLRVRHPDGKRVRTVEINGSEAPGSWDSERQAVRLEGEAGGSARVVLRY